MTTPTLAEALRALLPFVTVWNEAHEGAVRAAEQALAAHDAQSAPVAAVQAVPSEPDGTLHDDGYFTWKLGKRPNDQRDMRMGWRADFYLAPPPAAQPPIAQAAQRDALDAERYRSLRAGHAQAVCASLYGQDVPCDTPADWGRELDEWVDAELHTDALDFAARASIEGAAKP